MDSLSELSVIFTMQLDFLAHISHFDEISSIILQKTIKKGQNYSIRNSALEMEMVYSRQTFNQVCINDSF